MPSCVRSRPMPPSAAARPTAIVLTLGASIAFLVAILHPKTDGTPENLVAYSYWSAVHVLGALGFLLIGVAAATLALSSTRPLERLGLVGAALAALPLVVAAGIDGPVKTSLAPLALAGGATDIFHAFEVLEHHAYAFGFGLLGASLATVAAVEAAASRGVARAVAALGAVGYAALCLAGVVVIGLWMPQLSILFAGGLPAHGWLAWRGLRGLLASAPGPAVATVAAERL